MQRPSIHHHRFTLTAAEVGPDLEMPLSSLVTTIIDTATAHANEIGIGFNDLQRHNASWVLARLAIELDETPRVGGRYRLDTWVEGVSRLMSDRGFALFDEDMEQCIARAHTVWMAIDVTTRRPVNLSVLGSLDDVIVTDVNLSSRCTPLREPEVEQTGYDYTFKVSDIDVNRHVTTRRYIDLIVDLLPLEAYAKKRIKHFEIAFKQEARYGQTAHISLAADTSVLKVNGATSAIARMELADR